MQLLSAVRDGTYLICNNTNQKISRHHLLDVVMLLGIIYNLLQARDLVIIPVILLEFGILFYSCQPAGKPISKKLVNESITNHFDQDKSTGGKNGWKRKITTNPTSTILCYVHADRKKTKPMPMFYKKFHPGRVLKFGDQVMNITFRT